MNEHVLKAAAVDTLRRTACSSAHSRLFQWGLTLAVITGQGSYCLNGEDIQATVHFTSMACTHAHM